LAKLRRIEAVPLYASFERLFGGADKVPPLLNTPASQFRYVPRKGQHSTLVIAESDDGVVGIGECFGLPWAAASAVIINKVLAEVLVGQEIGPPTEMVAPIRKYLKASGHGAGVGMEALSGMDTALWDLTARREVKPLATLLGGTPGAVRTYVSPVPYLTTPEESAEAALAFVRDGYRAIKLKVGRGAKTDAIHVAAVREAIGPNVELRADVNCAYDFDTAMETARALRPYDLAWIEEPMPLGDPAELARFRSESGMRVAAGENEFQVEVFEALAKAGAVDELMPNIARVGGVSVMMEIGEICSKYAVGLSPHGVGTAICIAAALHVCRAAPAFSIYEANRLPNALRDDLAIPPLLPVDGDYVARDLPGHGCEIDWALAESYRLDRALAQGNTA
jgi:L-alanine-DL-glutamate epimerase-like enolase superfamily enzyme